MPHGQSTDLTKPDGCHSSEWNCPAKHPPVKPSMIHVWRAKVLQSPSVIHALQGILSNDEHARADRFRFHRDRESFIFTRGVLRILLSRYIDQDPSRLIFQYGSYGKPALSTVHHPGKLCFNLSHSHGKALYAFTLDRQIGIDIEKIRTDFATDEIAERFFSPYEHTKIKSLPSHQRVDAFFNCWTRKEAYIKAVGKGLSMPLDQFDVSVAPDEPAALLRLDDNQKECDNWHIRELTAADGYKAAVAVDEQKLSIELFDVASLLKD